MVNLWKKTEGGNSDMNEEQVTPVEATVEQTDGPTDYLNSEQLGPEGTPPVQEIAEPTLSGSTVDGGTDVQLNAEEPASYVTPSVVSETDDKLPAPDAVETATDIKPTEDTMPEETSAVHDIAMKAQTIQARSGDFEEEFNAVHATHDDLLKQILDLMAERTRLLTILRDGLASVNAHLSEFNAEKVDV